MLKAWYSTSNQPCRSTVIYMHSLTYPIFIFDADISSFLDKALHYVVMAFTSCQVQRSHLMERKKRQKQAKNQVTSIQKLGMQTN